MRRIVASLLAAVFASGIATAPQPKAIRSVKVDRQSLNVTAGETVTATIDFARKGLASILVVDRDGYAVRTLAKAQPVTSSFSVGWDGRDDSGQLVADEAYSLKVDWRGTEGVDTYFPANTVQPITAIEPRSYSRRSATLTYTLPRPSRVHIQAGTAAIDQKTKKPTGAVMKTVVNREPRIGGPIAEHWTGFDESGLIFVPDLPDFVVAIAASPLPENSVITFGNRGHQFIDTLGGRRGASLFTFTGGRRHHVGLSTADDTSPALAIEPLNATWSAADHTWTTDGQKPLRLRLSVQGPTAAAFRAHPATVELFVDGTRIGEPSPKHGDVVELSLEPRPGVRRVSVNWNSEWGPVAANTIQVQVREHATKVGAVR